MSGRSPAPLEAIDAPRAETLKRKILDRLKDLRRHLDALRAAMATFGEDFDLSAFRQAFDSQEPEDLHRVYAVERGVDLLYNYAAELVSFGLELAELRARGEDTNARRDIDRLATAGVISHERAQRLQRVRELRRLTTHEYPDVTAPRVHESALIVVAELPPFLSAYVAWVKAGFPPEKT